MTARFTVGQILLARLLQRKAPISAPRSALRSGRCCLLRCVTIRFYSCLFIDICNTTHNQRQHTASHLMCFYYIFNPLSPMGIICTAQWSIYVPHSGHYMYRTVVNICTAQWSLYVPHSGHYMYRTVVTIYTAQWSLYVPHSGHYIYCTVVTICTTSLTFTNSTFCPHSVFMCLMWI